MLPTLLGWWLQDDILWPAVSMLSISVLLAFRFRMHEIDWIPYNIASFILIVLFTIAVLPTTQVIFRHV